MMRQAVVLIHGIGEQRPMQTIRGFVESVIDATDHDAHPVYSKPDRMSELFELRRLVAEKTRTRPMTDFFEYYWAHHMEGTKLRNLWPWLRAVLLRSPFTVPPKLLVLWLISWLFIAGSLLFFLKNGISAAQLATFDSLVLLGAAILIMVIHGLLINTVGDAARYLSPLPSNIAVRHKIRSEGIRLLRRLHHSGHYDRIILVGHSLGSVIGYDILTNLWCNYNTVFEKQDRPRQRALEKVEKLGRCLDMSASPETGLAFNDAQRELWLEQRSLGFPWLITDFVTLGSPLAHAAFLLAGNAKELSLLQQLRELPTCPPVEDENQYTRRENYFFNGQKRSMRVLHHAALFACTRWSNIYFPLRFGVLGDFVGGPLRPVFGCGIADVPITTGKGRLLPLVPHIRYWKTSKKTPRSARVTAVQTLSKILSLNCIDWLPRRKTTLATVDSQGPPQMDSPD